MKRLMPLLALLAFASTSISALTYSELSQEDINELKGISTGLMMFEYFTKSSYPKYAGAFPTFEKHVQGMRGGGTVTVLPCGTRKNGKVEMVKKAEELEHLSPTRMLWVDAGAGIKMDEKYEGYAETLIGRAAFRLAETTGIINRRYKGMPVIDEYKAARPMPMNFRFDNAAGFQGFRKYLEKGFATLKDSEKPKNLPLLLLEIEEGFSNLTQDDQKFLQQHFKVVNPHDTVVLEFFKKKREDLEKDKGKFGGAAMKGQKFGDLALSSAEKLFGDFKYEKIGMKLLVFFVGSYGISKLWNMGKDAWLGKEETKEWKELQKNKPEQYEYKNKNAKSFYDGTTNLIKKATLGSFGLVAAAYTCALIYEASGTKVSKETPKAA